VSGGAHTSRTIMLVELRDLLSVCADDSVVQDYRSAAVEENVLGKASVAARERTFRYLRELYSLDLRHSGFAVLRQLWDIDAEAQPLIALLSALDRDPSLRATAGPILRSRLGDRLTSGDLAAAVQTLYATYSDSTASKIGRNTLSSWTQSGHLATVNRTTRVRAHAACRPPAVAFALFLAHRSGGAGQALFDTLYCRVLDTPTAFIRDQAFEASQRGWIDYREVGGIIEVGFNGLRRGAA
jgi:hypothetical protein